MAAVHRHSQTDRQREREEGRDGRQRERERDPGVKGLEEHNFYGSAADTYTSPSFFLSFSRAISRHEQKARRRGRKERGKIGGEKSDTFSGGIKMGRERGKDWKLWARRKQGRGRLFSPMLAYNSAIFVKSNRYKELSIGIRIRKLALALFLGSGQELNMSIFSGPV